jgi:hypothetical protein
VTVCVDGVNCVTTSLGISENKVVSVVGPSAGAAILSIAYDVRGVPSLYSKSYDVSTTVGAVFSFGVDQDIVLLSESAAAVDVPLVTPNPYRPSMGTALTISNLPTGKTLVIYTLSGVKVASLPVDGNGVVAWDALMTGGAEVPSGVYLAQVERDGGVQTFKIAIQR